MSGPTRCIEYHPTKQTVYLLDIPISLSEIRKYTEMDLGYISRIISGKQSPSLKYAQKISRALGMTLQDFLDSLPKNGQNSA